MRFRLLATSSLGLLSAACQGTYSQNTPGAAAPAYGNTYQSSTYQSSTYQSSFGAACTDYGFSAGTTNFNQCVARDSKPCRRPREPQLRCHPVDRGCAQRLQLVRPRCRDGVLRSLRQPRGRRPHLSRRRSPGGSDLLHGPERQPRRCPGLSHRRQRLSHGQPERPLTTRRPPRPIQASRPRPIAWTNTTIGSMPRVIASTPPAVACPSRARTTRRQSRQSLRLNSGGLARRIR